MWSERASRSTVSFTVCLFARARGEISWTFAFCFEMFGVKHKSQPCWKPLDAQAGSAFSPASLSLCLGLFSTLCSWWEIPGPQVSPQDVSEYEVQSHVGRHERQAVGHYKPSHVRVEGRWEPLLYPELPSQPKHVCFFPTGLFSNIMLELANISHTRPKWIVLDRDIDPMWIESLNTVMHDNEVKASQDSQSSRSISAFARSIQISLWKRAQEPASPFCDL